MLKQLMLKVVVPAFSGPTASLPLFAPLVLKPCAAPCVTEQVLSRPLPGFGPQVKVELSGAVPELGVALRYMDGGAIICALQAAVCAPEVTTIFFCPLVPKLVLNDGPNPLAGFPDGADHV